MKSFLRILLLAAAVPCLGGLTCEPLLSDSGFDVWCGDALCSWTVDKGQIKKVSTWHQSDYGAELVGTDVTISQLANITNLRALCIGFDLVAQVDPTANVTLQLDFLDDGHIDYSQTIPSSDWARLQNRVTTPRWYSKVRFIIHKEGPGRVVLAQIDAEGKAESDCAGAPVSLVDRANGALCASGTECASTLCGAPSSHDLSVCGGCKDSTDCAPGLVCGLEAGRYGSLFPACGATGRHNLGERCLTASECSTGTCCQGVCSTCCDGAGCPGTQQCQTPPNPEGFSFVPFQCAPAQRLGQTGALCLSNEDCVSGHCNSAGELKACVESGNPCEADTDCPDPVLGFFDAKPTPCKVLGVAHGACQ